VTRVLLIRHAESQPDAGLAEPDWPLNSTGQQQSKALAGTLQAQGVEVVYSSPYRRAVDTVRPLAAAAGLPISIEDDLRERKLTDGFRADWKTLVEKAWADWSFALPGCESGLDCQARVRACVDRLARENSGRTIALASHGNAIALYLSSLDETFGFKGWKSMKNPDIFLVNYAAAEAPEWDRAFEIH